jgi:hypothetical protein
MDGGVEGALTASGFREKKDLQYGIGLAYGRSFVCDIAFTEDDKNKKALQLSFADAT